MIESRVTFLLVIASFVVSCSSSPGSKDDYPRPDTPIPVASPRDGFVELSWPAVTNAVRYRIYWSTTPGGTVDMSDPIPTTQPTYTHDGRQNGTTYYYAVVALSEFRTSEKSEEVAATPIPPPDPPQNVRAILQEGAATVSWEPTPGATHYNLYVASDPTLDSKNVMRLPDGMKYEGVSNPYSYGNLDNKTYYFAVGAVNQSGESALSPIATATPIIISMAAGSNHTCAIKPGNALWCWGQNTYGQLGLGDYAGRVSQTQVNAQVGADPDWYRVAAGGEHTCAIKTNGTLFCWGRNNFGQLGDKSNLWKTSPVQIGGDNHWRNVALGTNHSCATKTDGTLWCWGSNAEKQLGIENIASANEPQQVGHDYMWSEVSLGTAHTCGLRNDGIVMCWGDNALGQLGNDKAVTSAVPVLVDTDIRWTRIAASGDHSCAIKTDTSLWCWGRNSSGQLGNSKSEAFHKAPDRVGETMGIADGWSALALGKEHSCATRIDGKAWCWGSNVFGQLRSDDKGIKNTPLEVRSGLWWHALTLGESHTCALAGNGNFGCWGSNSYGQLGEGVPKNHPGPVSISPDGDWRSITAGWYDTCAIKTDDSLWCWGGLLVTTPQRAGGDQRWLSVALADEFACAIRMDQTLWCSDLRTYDLLPNFPNNYLPYLFGTVGDKWRQVVMHRMGITCALKLDRTIWCAWLVHGENDFSISPIAQVGLDSDWETLSFARGALRAIKTNGSLWSGDINGFVGGSGNDWRAFSSDGQCAIKVGELNPCIVVPDETGQSTYSDDWIDVVIGLEPFSCGLKSNHTLWCWGTDTWGQFGRNPISNSHTPVAVQNASTWMTVSTGAHHTCAIALHDASEANQRLHCWGNNSYGQLGINSTTSVSTPAPVDMNSQWLAVAAGSYHTCGIKLVGATTSGDLWCWGSNGYGQLGAGYPDQKNVPAPVEEGGNWIAVAAGDNHSCALKNDGSLWCWGFNTYGQVGNGKSDNQLTPVQIDPATQWMLVAAGNNHTCAISVDGALWCWGLNESGQLGIDSIDNSLTPALVKADPARLWTAVAAGAKHTCATSVGELWCWGDNSSGQLAYGNGPSRRIPEISRKSVRSFSTGHSHTCIEYMAVYYQPEILCAGDNLHGQLGIDNPYSQPSPVPISDQQFMYMHYLNALVSGANHTCALRNDNYLWCWGDNTEGQIGGAQ